MDKLFINKFDKLVEFIKIDIKDNDTAMEIAERCIGYAGLIDIYTINNIDVKKLNISDFAVGNKYNKYLIKWSKLNS